jgi:hypothetical protein
MSRKASPHHRVEYKYLWQKGSSLSSTHEREGEREKEKERMRGRERESSHCKKCGKSLYFFDHSLTSSVPFSLALFPPSPPCTSEDAESQMSRMSHIAKLVAHIQKTSSLLRYPLQTSSTACVLFHQFSRSAVFADLDDSASAMACLFLGGKIEETPKKIGEVIGAFTESWRGESVTEQSPEYLSLLNEVLIAETHLLQASGFHFHFTHPYLLVIHLAKAFQWPRDVARKAFDFVSDSFLAPLCLSSSPQLIAASALYLASKVDQIPDASVEWWTLFGFRLDEIVGISKEIISLYPPIVEEKRLPLPPPPPPPPSSPTNPSPPPSPPPPPPPPSHVFVPFPFLSRFFLFIPPLIRLFSLSQIFECFSFLSLCEISSPSSSRFVSEGLLGVAAVKGEQGRERNITWKPRDI